MRGSWREVRPRRAEMAAASMVARGTVAISNPNDNAPNRGIQRPAIPQVTQAFAGGDTIRIQRICRGPALFGVGDGDCS